MVCMLLDGWSFLVMLVQAFVENISLFHYVPIVLNTIWAKNYRQDHLFGMKRMKNIRNSYTLWSERVYWIVWIGARLIWYPIVSSYSLWTLLLYYYNMRSVSEVVVSENVSDAAPGESIDWVYLLMVVVWVVFANADHFYIFYLLVKEEDEDVIDLLKLLRVVRSPKPPATLRRRVSFSTKSDEVIE